MALTPPRYSSATKLTWTEPGPGASHAKTSEPFPGASADAAKPAPSRPLPDRYAQSPIRSSPPAADAVPGVSSRRTGRAFHARFIVRDPSVAPLAGSAADETLRPHRSAVNPGVRPSANGGAKASGAY